MVCYRQWSVVATVVKLRRISHEVPVWKALIRCQCCSWFTASVGFERVYLLPRSFPPFLPCVWEVWILVCVDEKLKVRSLFYCCHAGLLTVFSDIAYGLSPCWRYFKTGADCIVKWLYILWAHSLSTGDRKRCYSKVFITGGSAGYFLVGCDSISYYIMNYSYSRQFSLSIIKYGFTVRRSARRTLMRDMLSCLVSPMYFALFSPRIWLVGGPMGRKLSISAASRSSAFIRRVIFRIKYGLVIPFVRCGE